MSSGFRHAPPNLLSVLTMPGRQGDPWVRGVGAFRVLMDPGLGWPLGPFVVVFTPQGVNEDTLDDVGWTLFGDADPPVSIKSEAWVVLDARDRDSEPGLVELTLEDFDEPPEVAVVRHIGDQRLGLATLRREPYRLIAPAITTIRIRGQCRVASIRISSVFPDVTLDSFVVLSAPVGRINGRYFGIDPDETAAMDRVANGAPLAFGPHESEPSPATDRDAEIAEQKRVDALAGWLRRALRAALAAPIGGHGAMSPLSSIHGHPTVTRAEFQDQMATLVAGGDLGIARWLGLADQLPDLGGNTMLVTTMGVWALSSAHPLARHASAISERGLVHSFFDSSGLEQVTKRADEMRASGLEPLWLYSQAWVDLDVAPDPPLPPTVQVRKPPLWIRGTTEDEDVGMLPVETYGVAMLGQVGLERRDPDPAPLHEFIEGTARLRSQLAVEGPAVTDRIAAPFGSRKYRGWQSDAFGRWSKDFDELPVPAFDRVPLAQPDPMVRLGNSAPSGDGLWTPVLLVRVGIPPRAGGQREIVSVLAETAVDTHLLSGLGQEFVDFQIAGPSLGPGDTTPATVTVTFRARADIEVSSATRSIDLIDPRPPPPPTPPPVLNFASRPDATGVSTALVPLPAAPRVDAYFVDVARESDLIVASGARPPDGIGRDARAQFWLQQPRHTLAPAFYRLTPEPVPTVTGSYAHDLPGDLAELVAFRLVPVGANHASPDAEGCGITVFAVPRDVAPPQPVLLLDRSVVPPVLEILTSPGSVRAVDARIRALPSTDADPRSARIVATGPVVDGVARLNAPLLGPAETAVYVAEVRGEQEAGARPSLGRWSDPSNAVLI